MNQDKNNDQAELLANAQKLSDKIDSLNKAIDNLQKGETKLRTSFEECADVLEKSANDLKKIETSLQKANLQFDANAKTLRTSNGAISQNKALLNDLLQQYEYLTNKQGENTLGVKELNLRIGQLSLTIQQQEEKLGKSREAFDFHKRSITALTGAYDEIKKSSGEFSPQLESVTKGFNAMKDGLKVVKEGFKDVGGAIKATGFGLLVLVLESVVDYLTKTKEGSKLLSGVLGAIARVVQIVEDAFANLGGVIVNALIHPVDSIKKVWNGIVENLANRFKALGVILDGVFHLDFKKIANGVIQLGTGVSNATTKITEAYKATSTFIKRSAGEVVDAYKKAAAAKKKEQDDAETQHKVSTKIHTEKITQIKQKTQALKQADDDEAALAGKESARLFNDFAKEITAVNAHYKELETQYKLAGKNTEDLEKEHLEALNDLKEKFREEDLKKFDTYLAALNSIKTKATQTVVSNAENNMGGEPGNEENSKQTREKKQGEESVKNDEKVAKAKIKIDDDLIKAKIHTGDKLINAVLQNTKKDSAIYKAAFIAKKATSIADTIISTKQSVMESFKAYSGIPFIGQALGIAQAAFMAVQGATSIAEIAKQKPGFAYGGQYVSDGRGAVLPGYSRTDNTNAYLRSGEAVVVSEAMRNPWARNLVSAINVAHGGRDFSIPNPGSGYAIGGIFTDGGNANRYYNQPMNDVKDLANTLAYQMINNFPPVYVDVKDINNQQNILAQTVNRVNL